MVERTRNELRAEIEWLLLFVRIEHEQAGECTCPIYLGVKRCMLHRELRNGGWVDPSYEIAYRCNLCGRTGRRDEMYTEWDPPYAFPSKVLCERCRDWEYGAED